MSYFPPELETTPPTLVVPGPLPAHAAPPDFTGYTTGFRDTPVGRAFRRLFRISASLQLAITLLTLFTLCLAVATFLESSYSGGVAQELIYHTWWFAGLLLLLAVNILCAALKKYPWKRHQTGFLITHTGLLVLVFGGLLTNLGGVEGQMTLIDSNNPEIHRAFRLSNKSDTIQLAGQYRLEMIRVPLEEGKKDDKLLQDLAAVVMGGAEASKELKGRLGENYQALSLRPGSFAWHDDEHFRQQLPWGIRFLSRLARPSSGMKYNFDEQTTLKVENYYPNTEVWPLSPAGQGEQGFPALRLKLSTPMAPRPIKPWVASIPLPGQDSLPLNLEFFVLPDQALLPEFLTPPEKLGTRGQLVLAVGYRRTLCRLNLDDLKEGEPVPLPGTALKFTLKKRAHVMELVDKQPEKEKGKPAHQGVPPYPAVQFELTGPAGTGTYVACARIPNLPIFQGGQDLDLVSAWYHYPEFHWGEKGRMGSLQFLRAPDGKVYYRVYGKDGLRGKGQELDVNDTTTTHALPFKPMEMKFQVMTWLPSALNREHLHPRQIRPGSEPSERLDPALRCTLSCKGESREFWVRMSPVATRVIAGKEMFFIRYHQDSRPLDFTLTLKRAEQVNDPGTSRAAAYQSEVVLGYRDGDAEVRQDHTISMNNTLDHGGYKVYQTKYQPLIDPRTRRIGVGDDNRMISMSGFTIADDPGLWFKYGGSILLVLGIATMFFMRAYFFKPRPRKAPEAA
jgi:hypothetical protein